MADEHAPDHFAALVDVLLPPPAQDATTMLSEHAEYLRTQIGELELLNLPYGHPALSHLKFVKDGIDRFLRGEAKTLDHALGLVGHQGRPRETKYVKLCAVLIEKVEVQGKSFVDVANEYAEMDDPRLKKFEKALNDANYLSRVHARNRIYALPLWARWTLRNRH